MWRSWGATSTRGPPSRTTIPRTRRTPATAARASTWGRCPRCVPTASISPSLRDRKPGELTHENHSTLGRASHDRLTDDDGLQRSEEHTSELQSRQYLV